jgi:hypothetical protein
VAPAMELTQLTALSKLPIELPHRNTSRRILKRMLAHPNTNFSIEYMHICIKKIAGLFWMLIWVVEAVVGCVKIIRKTRYIYWMDLGNYKLYH